MKELAKFILNSVDTLTRKYPDAAVFITGDFNTLDTSLFNKHLRFSQLVTRPTRGNNILDLFFTNFSNWYKEPCILPPVGKSDHNCILLRPQCAKSEVSHTKSVFKRHITANTYNEIAIELLCVKWHDMYRMDDCRLQVEFFNKHVHNILDKLAPVLEYKFKSSDRPWINAYFKNLIAERNKALRIGNIGHYKNLRNRVNRVSKSLKKQYYLDKVECLKTDNPAKWWQNIKSFCKMNNKTVHSDVFDNITFDNNPVTKGHLPDVINDCLLSQTEGIPVINQIKLEALRNTLNELPDKFIIEELDVFNALNQLKLSKAIGPDLVPNSILKNMSDILAAPICAIINSTIRQGIVPDSWKISRITPLPKVYPPATVEHDIRPIAITNSIAKVAERFIGQFFNEHFRNHIDPQQFGCTVKRSTTHALIKLTDEWFKASENCKNITRILFIDFTKAFDLIDHNVLMNKFIEYEFPPHVTSWLLSFLEDRKQFVSISNSHSTIRTSNAGAPQGTRAGPNVFKMLINSLRFSLNYAKYVDDITISSISKDPDNNELQTAVDSNLVTFTLENGMYTNDHKTKEMLVYFGTNINKDQVPRICINGRQIERVDTFKLLGVVISADLSWSAHVTYILNKTAKRVYCIRLLVRAGIRDDDIVTVYCSVIRSVLEYACPVWHPGLNVKQTKDIERVQKRCLRLIYPSLSYSEALSCSGLEKLSERREAITRALFEEMKDEGHVLHSLLPKREATTVNLRNFYPFHIPITKITRYGRAFVPYCISKRF